MTFIIFELSQCDKKHALLCKRGQTLWQGNSTFSDPGSLSPALSGFCGPSLHLQDEPG